MKAGAWRFVAEPARGGGKEPEISQVKKRDNLSVQAESFWETKADMLKLSVT